MFTAIVTVMWNGKPDSSARSGFRTRWEAMAYVREELQAARKLYKDRRADLSYEIIDDDVVEGTRPPELSLVAQELTETLGKIGKG